MAETRTSYLVTLAVALLVISGISANRTIIAIGLEV